MNPKKTILPIVIPLFVLICLCMGVFALRNHFDFDNIATRIFLLFAGSIGFWLGIGLYSVEKASQSLAEIKGALMARRGQLPSRKHPVNAALIRSDRPHDFTEDVPVTNVFHEEIFDLSTDFALARLKAFPRVGVIHAPAVFTALGILFTFYGLIAGISDLGLSQGSAAQMQAQLDQLIGGVGVAFVSSLFGIGASFVALVVSRWSLAALGAVCAEVRSAALKADREQSPVQSLSNIRDTSRAASEDIRQLITINRAQDGKLGSLASDLATTLDKILTGALQEQVARPLQQVSDNLERFANNQLDSHAQVMQGVMEDFQDGFNDTLGERFTQLNESLGEMITWHETSHKHYREVSQNLATHTEQQREVVELQTRWVEEFRQEISRRDQQLATTINRSDELMAALDNFAGNFDRAATGWGDATETIQAAHDGLEQAARQMTDGAVQLRQISANLLEDFAAGVQRVQRDLSKSLEDTSATIVELRESMTLMPDQYATLARDLRSQLHSGLKDSFAEFDKATADVVNHLSGTFVELQAVLEDTDAAVNGLAQQVQAVAQLEATSRTLTPRSTQNSPPASSRQPTLEPGE